MARKINETMEERSMGRYEIAVRLVLSKAKAKFGHKSLTKMNRMDAVQDAEAAIAFLATGNGSRALDMALSCYINVSSFTGI